MIISINEMNLVINFSIAIISSVIIALILKLPLLPDEPIRNSWDLSALFPTPVIAAGALAFLNQLNIKSFYNGMDLAIIIGLLSAIFVKYLLNKVFPIPSSVLEEVEE